MGFKKIAGKIHLALGLLTGLVFALVCLTGGIVAFTEESLDIANRKHIHVAPRDLPRVPIEKVLETYAKAYPKEKTFVFNAYREPDRAYDFFSAVRKPGKEDEFGGYKMVYADPYSGEILHVDKGTLDLIVLAVGMHTNLLMGEFGHGLIKACTLLFFVQLLAGLVLWWPKGRAALISALQWTYRKGPRRRTFDAHRVTGFYASAGLLVMVLTSLFMSWTWIAKPVVALFGGAPEHVVDHEDATYAKRKEGPEFSYHTLYEKVRALDPEANQITVLLPYVDTNAIITLRTNSGSTFVNFSVGRPYEFDRVTGEQDDSPEAKGKARNAQISAVNLLIHMGFWGGAASKILYFILAMAGTSLPVTGVLIWLGRRKRKGQSSGDGTPPGDWEGEETNIKAATEKR